MLNMSVVAMRRVHIVTFAKDGATRTVTLRRSLIVAGALIKLTLIVWAGFSLYLLLFRDTLVGKLIADQTQMRVEYEEKLAAQRVKLDEAATQQASAQDTFDVRLRELLARQAQLETRTETVAQLLRGSADMGGARARAGLGNSAANSSADRAGVSVAKMLPPNIQPPNPQPSDPLKAIADFTGQRPRPIDDSANVSSYAEEHPAGGNPGNSSVLAPATGGAAPGQRGLRPLGPRASLFDGSARDAALALAGPISIETVVNSLDTVERLQVETLEHANSRAAVVLDEMRGALRRSGLDPARLARASKRQTTDTGGPFMPLPKEGPSGFNALLHGLKVRLEEHDELSRTISMLPVRQPLPGQLEITSPYGARKDPFGMGWALHPGVDLRAEEGSIVRATAAGKIVNASYAGGYGNMVEIEHADGVNTRYGHLSAILVSDGQAVSAGTPIGRVGSTGRSTGPHLHYETRIDGEPVDPMRFLKSSDILMAVTGGVD